MKMTHSQAVVGIDVSSGKLDAHVHGHDQSRQVTNDASGHRELVAWARAKRATTAVMEASGGYERDLARALRRAEFALARRVVDRPEEEEVGAGRRDDLVLAVD